MSSAEDQFVQEFTGLRRGWGLWDTSLRTRVGPGTRLLCGIRPDAEDRDVRRLVLTKVKQLSDGFAAQDRRAIAVALGAEAGYQLPLLAERIQRLAAEHCVSPRTARRWVDRAFRLLAEEAAASLLKEPDLAPDDSGQGWFVRRFEALMRLDTPGPQLIDKRTIVALKDGLSRISVRFSLPRRLEGDELGYAVEAEVQQGARIESHEKLGEGHFHYVLALSKTLRKGEEHTYTMIFRVPRDQPIRPYYAFIPLVASETFQVRVRFDPLRLPKAVWRIHRLAPRELADRPIPGEPLVLDDADEVMLDFAKVEQGFGYGVGWLPG